MPNTRSAMRRTRRSQQHTIVNKIRKSKYRSVIKQMTIYLDSGKMNEAKDFLPKFAGEAQMRVMRDLRNALDPNGILNPGKMFD